MMKILVLIYFIIVPFTMANEYILDGKWNVECESSEHNWVTFDIKTHEVILRSKNGFNKVYIRMIDLNMTDFNGNYVIRKYNNAMGQYTGDYYYYQDIRGEGGHSEQEYLYVSVITGIVIHGVTRGNVTHTHAVTMTSITTGLSSEETVNGIKSEQTSTSPAVETTTTKQPVFLLPTTTTTTFSEMKSTTGHEADATTTTTTTSSRTIATTAAATTTTIAISKATVTTTTPVPPSPLITTSPLTTTSPSPPLQATTTTPTKSIPITSTMIKQTTTDVKQDETPFTTIASKAVTTTTATAAATTSMATTRSYVMDPIYTSPLPVNDTIIEKNLSDIGILGNNMTTLTSLQGGIKVHAIKMDTFLLALFCVIIAVFLLFIIIRNTTIMSKKIKFVKQIVLKKVGVLNSSTQVLPLPLHQVERERSMINTLSNNNKSTGSCNDEENEIRVGRSTSSTLAFAGKSSSDGVNFYSTTAAAATNNDTLESMENNNDDGYDDIESNNNRKLYITPEDKNQEERQSLLTGDIMLEEKKIRQRSCLPLKRKYNQEVHPVHLRKQHIRKRSFHVCNNMLYNLLYHKVQKHSNKADYHNRQTI